MSADNGIYILETSTRPRRDEDLKSVFRVAHLQAIDDFEYYEEHQPYNLGHYMLISWGNSEVFQSEEDALKYAAKLAEEIDDEGLPLEYGISSISRPDLIFWGD